MDLLSSRLTPINDAYETADRTYATLGIYGVDPDLVISKVGLNPETVQKIGRPLTMPSGSERVGRVNSWTFTSDGHVDSKDLRSHLNWILNKIEPFSTQILELQQLPETHMAMRCVWWSKYGGGGPTLWPEQMNRMAKLNLECIFSFAYYGDDSNACPMS